MAAITDYTTLAAAIDSWDERDHDADETIGLAEAEFRLYLGPNYAKDASVTLSFVSGSCALPAGYIRTLDLSHATYGSLTQATIGAVRERRINNGAAIPEIFAIVGSTFEVGSAYTGDLTLDYEGVLPGLTSLNATNWLIINAPQAYLSMCMHFAKAKYEDPSAPTYKAAALKTLNDLGIQSTVGQFGRGSLKINGPTP